MVRHVPRRERVSSNAAHLLRRIASRMVAPQFSPRAPIEFHDREYVLEIMNAGSPTAYSLAATVIRSFRVMSDSSATAREWVVKPARFVSRLAWRHWRASGSPRIPDGRRAAYEWTLPSNDFSFTPHGAIVTFQRIRSLPSSPAAVARAFSALASVGENDPTSYATLLRQYGFVLGTAPLSGRTRRAVLGAMALLPRVSLCGQTITRGRVRAETFCVAATPTRAEVVLNPWNGVVRAVRERLLKPAILYPDIKPGDLVSSDTFALALNGARER